jgi:hypothetical protein
MNKELKWDSFKTKTNILKRLEELPEYKKLLTPELKELSLKEIKSQILQFESDAEDELKNLLDRK